MCFAETLALADQLCTAADPSMNDSRAPVVIGIIVTIMTLASVSVVARIYSRKLSGIKLSWDDYLIMVALVISPYIKSDMFDELMQPRSLRWVLMPLFYTVRITPIHHPQTSNKSDFNRGAPRARKAYCDSKPHADHGLCSGKLL